VRRRGGRKGDDREEWARGNKGADGETGFTGIGRQRRKWRERDELEEWGEKGKGTEGGN
jgi:hypothetical protein